MITKLRVDRKQRCLWQITINQRSQLIGSPISDLEFMQQYSAVILSARRADSKIVCEANYSRFVVEAGD